MRLVSKKIGVMALVLAISICINTSTKAQSPADDPGIGGPGSPTIGVGADSGPVVPFDGGMSLIFTVSGVAYAAKRIKNKGLTENNLS